MLLCAGVGDVSVNCCLTLLGCRVAVAVIVVNFVSVVSVVLCCCSCTHNERNNYCCNKFFHFGLLLFIVIHISIVRIAICADFGLRYYDKQGGPRSEEVTTMRLACAVGATPNSHSKVVMMGLYSKFSASVAR